MYLIGVPCPVSFCRSCWSVLARRVSRLREYPCRTRDDSLAQGAFRQGKWKLITNEWCTTYVSFDPHVQVSRR